MADQFAGHASGLNSPVRHVWEITPHDLNAIDPLPRAVRVNGAGTMVFRTVDSSADVALTVKDAECLVARIKYIRATGTTATGFHGLV